MANKVSMDDIAQKLGISKNTVSLTLRGMPGISEQTRKLVLETARQVGYEYKKASNALAPDRKSTSKNICLIFSKSTRDSVGFFSYIQFGIEDEAKKNNINIILYCYDENDERFEVPICIKEGMISGIITLGRISEKSITSIMNLNLPIVMVDHYYDTMKLDCILTDNFCSGYIATEFLIKQGHRDIGFLGDINASISFYDRYNGFLKAMERHGIPVNPAFMISKSIESLVVEDMSLAVAEIAQMSQLPTAIFCCNDAEAISLCKTLSYMGINVPGDISIIGFDDIESAKNISPELTTMRVEKELMGKKAVQKLIANMNGNTDAPEKLLISTTLVNRQSVRMQVRDGS